MGWHTGQGTQTWDRVMASILITGANRGLGLEFARQYAQDGWRVFACCRDPDRASELQSLQDQHTSLLSIHPLDVTDHHQIERLAEQLRDEPLDVLLNNAGLYGPKKMVLGQLDYQAWAEVFAVNTLAPVKLAECFLPALERGERKLIASLTSRMGSIANNTEGRHYLYRSTKAALNSAMKSLAIDLQPRNMVVVVIHPGWVRTDMGGEHADLSPAESVQAVRKLLDQATLAESGKFFSYDGREIPW